MNTRDREYSDARDHLATMRTALVVGARTCVHTDFQSGTWRYHWRAGDGPRFDSNEWIEFVPEAFL